MDLLDNGVQDKTFDDYHSKIPRQMRFVLKEHRTSSSPCWINPEIFVLENEAVFDITS
jgi:hypothetical protein